MRTFAVALMLLTLRTPLPAGSNSNYQAPSYSAGSIVHAATSQPGPLAPNTFGTIYGTDLSYTTRALTAADIRAGRLPDSLDGVRVVIGGLNAYVFFVSPKQVNFLVPSSLGAGEVDLWLSRDGLAGPRTRVTLKDGAPGIFTIGEDRAAATHADGSLISATAPARPGEVIVLYGTGFGRTNPDLRAGELATLALPVRRAYEFKFLLNEAVLEPERVLYLGVTPGMAGLYQINLRLPDSAGASPRFQVAFQDGQPAPAVTFALSANPN